MIKECCSNPDNLEPQPHSDKDIILKVCRVCSCRHFELTLDTGKLGFSGKGL